MDSRPAARRRLGRWLLPLAIALLGAGIALGGGSGVGRAVGLAALAYGIGLLVAALFLLAGHNPLSRKRPRGR